MQVLSVNIANPSFRAIGGEQVLTAIGKQPVSGPVAVRQGGLAGDEVADPSLHGGVAKALYAYPSEHFPFWRTVRAQARAADWDAPVAPGLLGENLTLAGLTEDRLWIGDRLRLPDCVLAVSEPRFPCFKLNAALGFAHAARMMQQSGFCGAYLGVIVAGTVCAGDPIVLEPGPRELPLRDLFRARLRHPGDAPPDGTAPA
jgi:MOSC domain-containing protein YiiM